MNPKMNKVRGLLYLICVVEGITESVLAQKPVAGSKYTLL